jgi:hypothetical protein
LPRDPGILAGMTYEYQSFGHSPATRVPGAFRSYHFGWYQGTS